MKTKLELIFSILIVLLFLIGGVSIWYYKNKADNLESFQSIYQAGQQPNKVWQSKDSSWHNQVQNAEVSSSELKYVKELQGIHAEFDGVHKSLNNLENYQKIASVTTIHKTIHEKDTLIYRADSSVIKGKTFSYSDKYTSIKEMIGEDSSWIDIQSKDSLEIAQYWDRSWFLGKKKYQTEIESTNPNTEVVYQQDIKVKRKKGLFKIL